VKLALPRYVIPKRLSSGRTAFYFNVPKLYLKAGCPRLNEPLGDDYTAACGRDGKGGRAETLNGLFDEWDQMRRGAPISSEKAPSIGSVDWLFREYKQTKAYTAKVAIRSRKNYEWAMREVCNSLNKKGIRIGNLPIKSITPRAADKLYDLFTVGSSGERLRTAEKMVALCRKAWRVVHRLYPTEFAKDIPNPWHGVTMKTRVKLIKAAASRAEVYTFVSGCLAYGEIEIAAAAVICFEWLQRPENVIAGHLKWSDYRSGQFPTAIRIVHHKTGQIVLHPLEEQLPNGEVVKFYADAEAVLARLTRRGLPMILREVEDGVSKPYSTGGIQKIVQRMRKVLNLPTTFTLDACRHGGMTELEEAELTDGQGRALSAHKTQQSYEGYAKRNLPRALSATRKRYAHTLANAKATNIQNGASDLIQNGKDTNERSA
jgi:hypothetical protein